MDAFIGHLIDEVGFPELVIIIYVGVVLLTAGMVFDMFALNIFFVLFEESKFVQNLRLDFIDLVIQLSFLLIGIFIAAFPHLYVYLFN